MVRDSDWGASPEAITRLLEANLPIETMLSLIRDFEYPIPSYAGLEVSNASVGRDGTGLYTTVSVSLK